MKDRLVFAYAVVFVLVVLGLFALMVANGWRGHDARAIEIGVFLIALRLWTTDRSHGS